MFSISGVWRKTLIISVGLLVLLGGVLVPVQGAQIIADGFDNNGGVNVDKPSENLYVAANNLNISGPVKKDLTAAGGTVQITSRVERGILASGGTVQIDSAYVGASVRVAGGQVLISGNFNEDVVVTAGEVTFRNAQIRGDVMVSSGKIILENTKIFGKFNGTYGDLSGDLSGSVYGEIRTYTTKKDAVDSNMILFTFAREFSTIFALTIVVYILFTRGKLKVDEIKFNSGFGIDVLIGLGYLVLPIIVLIIGSILQLYPLLATIWGIIILLMILSTVYLPVYIANLIINSLNLKYSLVKTVIVVYIVSLLLGLIPYVNQVVGLIYMILFMANFGFLSRKIFSVFNTALKEIEEN